MSSRQIARIARGFIESPSTDYAFLLTLRLLSRYDDPALDRAIVQTIEEQLEGERLPGWICVALKEAFRRFGDPDPAARIAPLGPAFYMADPVEARRIWRQARVELEIR